MSRKKSSACVMAKKSVVAQECSPKTLSHLSYIGSQEEGFWRPTTPSFGAIRRPGYEKHQCVLWEEWKTVEQTAKRRTKLPFIFH
jgi:hypothetical protein